MYIFQKSIIFQILSSHLIQSNLTKMKIIRQSLIQKQPSKLHQNKQQSTPRSSKMSPLSHYNYNNKFQQSIHGYLSQISHDSLRQYFPSFQIYPHQILPQIQKKHTQMAAGLYILLQGKICFTWTEKSHDLDRKQQMFAQAKSGTYFYYHDPCINDDKLQKYQSFVLEEKGTIFQCLYQNCFVLEDCVVGKVNVNDHENINNSGNSSAVSGQGSVNGELMNEFQKNRKNRNDLMENCHYLGQRNQSDRLFSVNLNVYSNFKKYQYKFHNKIELNSVGIVFEGILKSCRKSSKNDYFQLQKYAILLPGIPYEVLSAQAQILLIQKNPTLHYNHPELIQAHKSLKQNEQTIIKSLHFDRKLKTSSCSSLHSRTPTRINMLKSHSNHNKVDNNPFKAIELLTKNMKNWQINKRRKKLTNISKKYQNQLIITMETCKQSLSFSQKQTSRLHQQNGKYKKPKILFDYSKYCTNKSMKSLHSVLMNMGKQKNLEKHKAIDEQKKNTYQNGNYIDQQKDERKRAIISRTQVLSSLYSKNGQNQQKQVTQRRERRTYNDNLFDRYKNISAELYKKYKKQKQRSKINQISKIQLKNL